MFYFLEKQNKTGENKGSIILCIWNGFESARTQHPLGSASARRGRGRDAPVQPAGARQNPVAHPVNLLLPGVLHRRVWPGKRRLWAVSQDSCPSSLSSATPLFSELELAPVDWVDVAAAVGPIPRFIVQEA